MHNSQPAILQPFLNRSPATFPLCSVLQQCEQNGSRIDSNMFLVINGCDIALSKWLTPVRRPLLSIIFTQIQRPETLIL